MDELDYCNVLREKIPKDPSTLTSDARDDYRAFLDDGRCRAEEPEASLTRHVQEAPSFEVKSESDILAQFGRQCVADLSEDRWFL